MAKKPPKSPWTLPRARSTNSISREPDAESKFPGQKLGIFWSWKNHFSKQKDDPQKIKQTANNIVRMFSYLICHMMIHKVSNAVAQKNITLVADEIASKISSENNSPVAKLTAFSITLSSGKFNMKRLEELHDEFYKKNILAHNLLCDIVRNYIYTNNIEHSKKQRIADVLKLKVQFKPTLPRNNS